MQLKNIIKYPKLMLVYFLKGNCCIVKKIDYLTTQLKRRLSQYKNFRDYYYPADEVPIYEIR